VKPINCSLVLTHHTMTIDHHFHGKQPYNEFINRVSIQNDKPTSDVYMCPIGCQSFSDFMFRFGIFFNFFDLLFRCNFEHIIE
jgi:hypothetical protein